MNKVKIIYCLFLVVFSLQLGAMEEQKTHLVLSQVELPEELYIAEILSKIKTDLIYCTNNILNNKENTFLPYNKVKKLNLAYYPYLGGRLVPLKDSVEHFALPHSTNQYILVTSIYNDIARIWDLMQTVQSLSCVNKQWNTFFQKDIQKVKEAVGYVIIEKADYYSIILNMLNSKKADDFFAEKSSVHYFIAYTMGYYCALKETLPDNPVVFSVQKLLWDSCRIYANAEDCEERILVMPTDQPANESINKFILCMFKGMLSLFHKDKQIEITIKASKYCGSTNLSNTDYIEPTAKKMNLDVRMSFESFSPQLNGNLHIFVKYRSKEKGYVIQ